VNISNQQILEKYAQPTLISSTRQDTNSPLAYKDWYKAYRGIIPSQEFNQYNDYLVNWYRDKSLVSTDTKLRIKLNYLTFLRQLQLFLSSEELENWYTNVDLNNDKELLLAIPYFAKKLKDISLYYLKLRNTVKESKLRYNQVGTNLGIIDQIQKFILSEYSKKNNSPITVPASVWQTLPELSAIRDSITIQLDELYDDHVYFDRSPTLPISAYFDLDNEGLQKFLTSKNLQLTSTEWIYQTGVFALSNDFSDFSNENRDLLASSFPKKYLGRNKYTTEYSAPSSKKDFYTINIGSGNNFFYWPSYVYRSQALLLPRHEPISIHDLNIETLATAGSGIQEADTIFVKTVLGTQGAWLRNQLYDYKEETLECTLNPSTKTVFKFPYPGLGLSGEDIPWTGFGFKTDNRYQYLNDELKQNVEKTYWSTDTSLTAVDPISINNSTLIKNKAYATKNYTHSDKIKTWPFAPGYDETSFNFTPSEAWLYRYETTDLSIKRGSNSVILWPYENINTQSTFPTYFPDNMGEVCNSLPVSAINFVHACGSNSLSSADVIYKLKNYKDSIERAIECCWLSAGTYSVPELNLTMPLQNSLQLYLSSGEFGKFIWTGPDYTNANDVFKTIKHQPDCKFVTTRNNSYLDFKTCDCKQVLFSPFGHPGEKYTDYRSLTDFIIEDNSTPENLDLSNQNLLADTFGWYKTNKTIGWGDGTWRSHNSTLGNIFYLRKNKKYIYYRANVIDQDQEDIRLPHYILRYQYPIQNKNLWVKAKRDINNNWVSTNEESKMVVNPGDILLYSRSLSSYYTLSGALEETVDILENRGSIWSNADYTTISDIRPIVVSYPSMILRLDEDPQYPELFFNDIVGVKSWSITRPDSSTKYFQNTQSIIFVPSVSGTYTVSVTALTAITTSGDITNTLITTNTANPIISGYYIFNNIPAVTALSPITLIPSFSTIEIPVPGYVLNTKLFGWDYNTSTPNQYARVENTGAKPFWAKAYSGKNQFTGYGGINSAGNYIRVVDDHNLISQPRFSDIVFTNRLKVEYERVYPEKIIWSQPLNLQVTVDENQWCTLEFTTSSDSNLAFQLGNLKNDLIVNATSSVSNIILENIVENEPVEIYYNALNSFVWNITTTPQLSETVYPAVEETLSIEALQPYANFSNQFFPSIASFPAFEDLYSVYEEGGYFIPTNLGASRYVNKYYNVSYNLSGSSLSGQFSDDYGIIEGRGLSKQHQETPYNIDSENNGWMKEPFIAGQLAGNVNKEIFKTHQKFIPYQSGYDTNPNINLGLVTPKSMQTPWTGKEGTEWKDLANYPVSYTGELDIKQWTEDQILKKSGFLLDNWVTDIFGNQYGLYKDIKNVSYSNRINTPGEIWVRKNSQFVASASVGMSAVFDSYTGMALMNDLTGSYILNYINDLSGSNIKRIDMFFDTMLIETPGVLIFEKINYNFDKDEIFSITDNARHISLVVPVSTNLLREFEPYPTLIVDPSENVLQENEFKILLENSDTIAKPGDTWFFPEQKLVTVSMCSLSSGIVAPELYQLDLNKLKLQKLFPLLREDILSIASLTSLNLQEIGRPLLSYNSLKREYLFTLLGKNEENRDTIIEFNITNVNPPSLKSINVYTPNPIGTLTEPPVIKHSLNVTINFPESLNFQLSAENNVTGYEPVDTPGWVGLTEDGLFIGTPPEAGIFHATFVVYNDYGPIYYSLTINVLPINYLFTDGYLDLLDLEDVNVLTEPEVEPEEQKIIVKPSVES
jgi:hypothetical protein